MGIGPLNDWSMKCQILILLPQLVQRHLIGSHSVLVGCGLVWPVLSAVQTPPARGHIIAHALRVMKSRGVLGIGGTLNPSDYGLKTIDGQAWCFEGNEE